MPPLGPTFAFPIGGISIGGVQLSTDPEIYEPLNWQKRYSIHQAIGGALTIQDFGLKMKDNTIKLATSTGQYLDTATVQSLHAQYQTRGATFAFVDWMGNNMTVFWESFIPIIHRPGLYRYKADLHVLSISQLWGQAYSGG
jgi:hypothetical protein